MRKRLKNKKCCCKMCKAYKRGWTNRWKVKEEAKLKPFISTLKIRSSSYLTLTMLYAIMRL